MAKLAIKKASTDVTTYVFIQDSSKTTGEGLTGLVYNTTDLVASYVRPLGTRKALTLATLAAADSAHSDGGFKEVDATNMPGVYRLDLPDAVCATGVPSVVVMLKGATNMSPVVLEIQLTDFDLNTAGVTLATSQPAITWGQQKIIANANGEGALDIVNTSTGGGGVGIHTEGQFAGQFNEATGASSIGVYNIGIYSGQYNAGEDVGVRNYGGLTDVIGYDPAIATASNLQTVDDNVDSILADTGTDGVVLKAAGLNADAVAEIQSGLALEATLTAIKGAGWTNQTLVKIVTDIAAIQAGSGATAQEVWEYATRVLTAGTNIDLSALATATDLATVDTVVDAIKAKTDNLPASPASAGEYTSALTAIQADLDNPNQYKADVSGLATQASVNAIPTTPLLAANYVAPDNAGIAAILEDTGTTIPATLAGLATSAALDAVDNFVDTEVAAILAAVDTEVAAIKAKTDNLPASPASAGEYTSALTAIQNDLDNPNQYKADVSNLALQVTSLAIKGQTDKIPAAPAQTDEYDAALAAIQADLDNPNQYKADVSALMLASSYVAPNNAGITAIKAKTDNLPANTATALAAIQSDLDNPAQYKADVSGLATTAHVQEVENKIDAIDVTTVASMGKIDALDVKVSAIDTDSLMQYLIDGYTFEQIVEILAAVLAGKLTRNGNTLTFRDLADTLDRLVVVTDNNKQRIDTTYTV